MCCAYASGYVKRIPHVAVALAARLMHSGRLHCTWDALKGWSMPWRCSCSRVHLIQTWNQGDGYAHHPPRPLEAHTLIGSHQTPLHLACEWGHANVVQLLLRHGANVDATNVSTQPSCTPVKQNLTRSLSLTCYTAEGRGMRCVHYGKNGS